MAWALAIIGVLLLGGMYLMYWRMEEHERFLDAREHRLEALLAQNKTTLTELHAAHADVIAKHHPHPHGPVR